MIPVTPRIALDEDELQFDYIRASGPGGQNVNKVSSAVQMRFDIRHSRAFDDETRRRLERLAGSRLTNDGVIVISAQRFRDQIRNREDAIQRLVELIRQAAHRDKPRRATKPTFGSQQRRLESKGKRSVVKKMRGGPIGD